MMNFQENENNNKTHGTTWLKRRSNKFTVMRTTGVTFDKKDKPILENKNLDLCNQLPVRVLPIPNRAHSMQDISYKRPLSAQFLDHTTLSLISSDKGKSISQFELNSICNSNSREKIYKTRYAMRQQLNPIAEEINTHYNLRRKFVTDEDEYQSPKKRNKSSLLGIKNKLHRKFGRRKSSMFIKPAMHTAEENNNEHELVIAECQKENTIFHNFKEILQNTDKCSEFRTFLSQEHSEENLDFWKDCEKYKSRSTARERIKLGKKIYKRYLSENSVQEINLLSSTKQELSKILQHHSTTVFDKAQNEIYTLMQTDSYPRFVSAKFKLSI